MAGKVDRADKGVSRKQPRKTVSSPPDADVGAEPIEPSQWEAGLAGVELPGMEVEHRGSTVRVAPRAQECQFHERKWEQPKVPSSAHGDVHSSDAQGRRRDLKDLVPSTLCHERTPWCIPYPVAIMADWVDRGIVEQSHLPENIQGPRRLAHQAEGRRAVSQDRSTRGLLQGLLAHSQVLLETLWIQEVDPAVVPAVARHLMTGFVDCPYQPGVGPSDLAHNEECGKDLPLGEQLEDPLCHPVHPLTVFPSQYGINLQPHRSLDAVVFLNVEAQNDRGRIRAVRQEQRMLRSWHGRDGASIHPRSLQC